VLPERPVETAGLKGKALRDWVTRDSMIGTGLPKDPKMDAPKMEVPDAETSPAETSPAPETG
jgi:hypothetical protein